jgi:MmgE/PrpD C-terminal domain
VLSLDPACDRICNIPAPADGLQAKFSLRQTVAMALSGVDTASLSAYSAATATDPALVRLRERLTFDFREGGPPAAAELSVTLADGRIIRASHDAGVPSADIVAQAKRLAAKFDALVAPVLGTARARELREAVAGLDGLGEIGDLARLAAATG